MEPTRDAAASRAAWAALFLRIALAAGFLSAVADRFGLWGAPGTQGVVWGEFSAFQTFTAQLNPWSPAALVPVLAWGATAAEIALGILLLVGWRPALVGLASAVLLLCFAVGLVLGLGLKAAFDYSVPAAAGAAFALAVLSGGKPRADDGPLVL